MTGFRSFFQMVSSQQGVKVVDGFGVSFFFLCYFSNWKATSDQYIMVSGTCSAEYAASKLKNEDAWVKPLLTEDGRALCVFGCIHYDNSPVGQVRDLEF